MRSVAPLARLLASLSLCGCEAGTLLAWSFFRSGLGPDGQSTIVLRAIRYSMEQACGDHNP